MQNKSNLTLSLALCGFFIAAGFATCGYFIAKAIERFKLMDRSVVVTGLAEKIVKSNLAELNLSFTEVGDELEPLSKKMQQNKEAIIAFLKKQGINQDEIHINAVNITDKNARDYGDINQKKGARYILRNTIIVTSSNVDLVSKIPEDLSDLLNQNIVVSASVKYQFTKFTDLKPEMLAEATINARKAADQFAKNSSSKVGVIKSARQGVFTITAKNFSREDHDYNESDSLEKKIRVVSTITFSLEDA